MSRDWQKAISKITKALVMDIPFWAVGFPTLAKARRATRWGGVACFITAVRKLIGEAMFVSSSGKPLDHEIAWLVGASIIPTLILAAGVRLFRGNGRASGCVAVVLVILDAATANVQIASPRVILSSAISGVLLILIINGVRAAFALKQVDYRAWLRETFD